MNESNQTEEKVEMTGPQVNSQGPKKGNGFLKTVLLCVLCTACGFGGGYVANQYTGGNLLNFPTKETPVQEEVQTEDLEVQEEVVKQEKPTQAPQVIYQGFSVKDIAAKVTPSVVEIKTETIATSFFFQEYVAEGAGSGVIISEDGYIVTNNHVVENSKSVSVTLNDGTSYEAKVIGTDSKTDIAILKIEAEGLTAAEIGDSSELVVGDNVIAVGNPLGSLGGTVTDGIVSALERELTIENETFNLLQTNAAINPGNSGGGLFNDKGELIGIVNAKEMLTANGYSVEGLGFAIPINDVKVIMDDIMQNGYVVNRPTIGVYLTEIAQDQGEYKAGVYITQIIEGSGAEAAGLEAYDRIIAVDDKEVTSYSELSKLLKNYKVGDTIKITVVRDGTQVTADVTLTQAIVQNETVEE